MDTPRPFQFSLTTTSPILPGSESNQQYETDKFNRVDLAVEDEFGEELEDEFEDKEG